MEDALHFFDGLKDKCMHQAHQAIEEWDYQDFSPDLRSALLDGEVKDERHGERKVVLVAREKPANWVGLSPEAALDDTDCGTVKLRDGSHSFEQKAVMLVSPSGGVQGLPDPETTKHFLDKATGMDAKQITDALFLRLQEKCWQVRSKALVIMQQLLETNHLCAKFFPVFEAHAVLQQCLDKMRREDHNYIARENARKALSLIQSKGRNALLLGKEHVAPKIHTRHPQLKQQQKKSMRKDSIDRHQTQSTNNISVSRKKSTTSSALHVHTMSTVASCSEPPLRPSPRVVEAALASWKRRSVRDMNELMDTPVEDEIQPSSIQGAAADHSTSSSSGFSFMNDRPLL